MNYTIVEANIHTTQHGFALNSFQIMEAARGNLRCNCLKSVVFNDVILNNSILLNDRLFSDRQTPDSWQD